VSRRRLVPLALVVTLLLAVVAIAAGGRPLGSGSGGRGAGLPRSFWDYAFTTTIIVEVFLAALGLVALFFFRHERTALPRYQPRTLRTLLVLILGAALLTFVAHRVDLHGLFHSQASSGRTHLPTATGKRPPPFSHGHARFRWEELVVVLGVLLALAFAGWATRRRLASGGRRLASAPETLAEALDESLDDLREDPDLRRAIIAAYARMERALAAAGVPRHHAEAPLEYVERALLSLDASAAAVRRLTDLFEWARFSHHEPDPSMRDEAVDALVAVRDELRDTEPAPA
jgi:hypothetical protein